MVCESEDFYFHVKNSFFQSYFLNIYPFFTDLDAKSFTNKFPYMLKFISGFLHSISLRSIFYSHDMNMFS